MSEEKTPLQQKIGAIFADLGVTEGFMAASDHAYSCKCDDCLKWWLTVGPEDAGGGWSFGPFTQAEFEAAGGVVPEYIEWGEDGIEEYEDIGI